MINYFLACQESYEEGDHIWFSSYTHNGLYRVNKKTKETQLMTTFPGEKGMAFLLYKAIVHINEWLIFIPCAAKDIAVYNYKKNQIKKIPLRESHGKHKVIYQENCKFWTAVPYKNNVYLFGLCYPAILRLNLETWEIVYYAEWLEEVDPRIGEKSEGYWSDGIIRGKYAYLPCLYGREILKFDLENGKMRWLEVSSKTGGFHGIGDDGTYLWLTPVECQNVVKWNPESGDAKEIGISYENEGIYPFQKPLLINGDIYLLPFGINDAYKINLRSEKAEKDRELSKLLNIKKKKYSIGGFTVLNPRITEDGFSYINGRDYSWHTYNVKTKKEIITSWKVGKKEQEYIEYLYIRDFMSEGHFQIEKNDGDLLLVLRVLNSNCLGQKNVLYNERTGKIIYSTVV